MKRITLSLILAFAFASCHNGSHYKGPGDAVAFPPPVVKADAEAEQNAPVADRITSAGYLKEKNADVVLIAPPATKAAQKSDGTDTTKKITKEGEIHFQTADVVKTRKNILRSVQKSGGYVAEDTQSKYDGSDDKTYTLKVRIPAKNFDMLVDTVAANADKVDSRNISVKDITTEYIDTKTQLENKKKLEQTYIGLLANAAKMADVLQIEDKISEIQTDIESTQGQLNYMTKQVAYSSLDITFYSKPASQQSEAGFFGKLTTAITGGWDGLQNFFFCLVNIWPFLIISAVLLIIFIKQRRGKRLSSQQTI